MAKELHELNELEERVILVAVEMDERSSQLCNGYWMRVWMSWRSW